MQLKLRKLLKGELEDGWQKRILLGSDCRGGLVVEYRLNPESDLTWKING